MEKLIKNTINKTYCLRHCRQGTPKRAVHAEGGAVSINTKIKSEDTEITDSRNRLHMVRQYTCCPGGKRTSAIETVVIKGMERTIEHSLQGSPTLVAFM